MMLVIVPVVLEISALSQMPLSPLPYLLSGKMLKKTCIGFSKFANSEDNQRFYKWAFFLFDVKILFLPFTSKSRMIMTAIFYRQFHTVHSKLNGSKLRYD